MKEKPYIALIIFLIFAVSTKTAIAKVDTSKIRYCPNIPTSNNLYVIFVNNPVTYDDTKSTNEISEYMPSYDSNNHLEYALGKAIAYLSLSTQLKYTHTVRKGHNCIYLTRATINAGYEKPLILITKDAPKDSCVYKYIKYHEELHHKVNDQTLKDYTPLIQDAFKSVAKKYSYSDTTDSPQAVMDKIGREFENKVSEIQKDFRTEMNKRQAVIDTEHDIYAIMKKCSEIDGKKKTMEIMDMINPKL